MTYCAHCDIEAGRVSLRPLTTTQEPDIVLDVQGPGAICLSAVDNLLVVHRPLKQVTLVFDLLEPAVPVRTRDHNSSASSSASASTGGGARCLVPLLPPCKLDAHGPNAANEAGGPGDVVDIYSPAWRYEALDVIIDDNHGLVFRLELNVDPIIAALRSRPLVDLVRVLLRRSECRSRLISVLLYGLQQQESVALMGGVFGLLNRVYREAIERAPRRLSKSSGGRVRKATVTLDSLVSTVGTQTMLSERDVVMQVFYAHIMKLMGKPADTPLFDLALAVRAGKEPMPPATIPATELAAAMAAAGSCSSSSFPISSGSGGSSSGGRQTRNSPPYILCCIIEYAYNLLSLQILPHRLLQLFLFDACVLYKQDTLLQQLFQYHVLLDSNDLNARLLKLWKVTGIRWARQAALDLAIRLGQWPVAVDVLVQGRQYCRVLPLLRRHRVTQYPLCEFLSAAANDVAFQRKDPYLWMHLLGSLKAWLDQSPDSDKPNVEGCGQWLPEVLEGPPPGSSVPTTSEADGPSQAAAAMLEPSSSSSSSQQQQQQQAAEDATTTTTTTTDAEPAQA
eukprot:GHVU01053416.1.p1 GENE.GHVU01053416.1~~GHVU01053416.1.p1  ORF type:complete len:564 (+),score=163.95 GHVU01053416.1:1334-3025(+)